ncbi:MAG TPA: Rieske (2Fe-2S) protein [Candidatus Dormibacteraeota bacterium]
MSRQGRLAGAVEAMLRDRRPRSLSADADEAAQLRTAALLRSAHPGADLPSTEFVDRLGQQLRRQAALDEAEARAPSGSGRRAFLRGVGIAAAAVAAGVGVDRAVTTLRSGPDLGQSATNVPDAGDWAAVASLAAVRATPALRFRAGSVEGVLVARADGGVDALSAVCTHLGCLLKVDAPGRRLACPCHAATFALDGTPASREYLRPLPRLQSRVNGDQVEVYIA